MHGAEKLADSDDDDDDDDDGAQSASKNGL